MAWALPAAAAVPAIDDGLAAEIRALRDPSQDQRLHAAMNMYNHGTDARAALPALSEALGSESDAEVRKVLAQTIGAVGTGWPEAIAPLVRALQHDAEAGVRQNAAKSLGEIALEPSVTVPALMSALHDQSAEVRYAAGEALGKKGFAPLAGTMVPALVAALADADSMV